MLTIIKGIYENGTIRLMEEVPSITHSEVLVTFLNDEKPKKEEVIGGKVGVRLGSLEGRFTIPDDFNEPMDDLKDYM